MDLLIATNSVPLAQADAAPATGTPQYATNGNPVTGTPATDLPAYEFNAVIAEIVGAISGAGLMPDRNNNAQLLAAIKALIAAAGSASGQCYLSYTGPTQITLAPKNGNQLRINGKTYSLPAAGVAIANTGVRVSGVANQNVAAGVTYLVFAMDDGNGNVVPDFWPVATGHMPDTNAGNVGVEVRNNVGVADSTRTLIGMIESSSGGQFQSGLLTLSWFNRQLLHSTTQFSADRSTTSTSYVELNSEIRNSFLVFAGEEVQFAINGGCTNNTLDDLAITSIAFDGTAPEPAMSMNEFYASGSTGGSCHLSGAKAGLAEGLHYATLIGDVGPGGAGTATWYGESGSNPVYAVSLYIAKAR